MALRPILIAPDPRLKAVSEPVAAVTDEIRALMDDMLETMYAAPGIGLAAVQVGVAKRVIVIDLGKRSAAADDEISDDEEEDFEDDADDDDDSEGAEGEDKKDEPNPMYFVNPEIVWASDDLVVCEEGCLSVPDLYDEVERPSQVKVRFLDYHGQVQEIDAKGMLAVCIQHEMDHLEGTLFIDHLSRLKREMMLRKLTKARKAAEREAVD
ncbi:MAG: peptide deformylase [Alphaproteobacteria bacterium]|nr:peptide deformylase [Alphaproteobacteria bacterium]